MNYDALPQVCQYDSGGSCGGDHPYSGGHVSMGSAEDRVEIEEIGFAEE